ncbi:MAG: hypothetical protein NVSMB5_05880 [Candidatus Velthaea sp.]
MHELGVALSLLDGIDEASSRAGAPRILAVHVRVGALSGVSADALQFAWDLATEDTVAAGARLVVESVSTRIRCTRCTLESEPVPGTGLACGFCGAVETTIVRGRELQLAAMEVMDGNA